MCTDKVNFPKLTEMNFNSNAYNEFNDGFDAALRNACNRVETGVSIRAMQDTKQCRFTWNWEMGDTLNTYGDGPYPNSNTEPCDNQ
ncbi:hypothetical protein JH06_1983 [Blastocystis sp. subtype 4]|uniref:hypothetical protein n=1 Tax=Blastocystis sp. subtype 4 TaxID=944170 RepID=UPI000712290F|nr:hypothetical protein JH06_1983 [Blastocystis sp. subtype 4]KNB44328.1 hypothetical protein JH06_1983 [Blastocystis sp. subtype 4]|eukprot:XP_014527771.1 hypothetical protein JH06_1983 [Blastocystis sp. subtype 4]